MELVRFVRVIEIVVCVLSSVIGLTTIPSRSKRSLSSNFSLCSNYRTLRRSVMVMSIDSFGLKTDTWWSKGLNFECTQCGKCCKVTGDVWLNSEEANLAASGLGIDLPTFGQRYTDSTSVNGWMRLSDKTLNSGGKGCIFLQDDEKTCSIYDNRPLQCKTYPWWPRLLKSKKSWESESVVPDHIEGANLPRWSESGGCEGISEKHALITKDVISRNLEEYAAYMRRFPRDALLKSDIENSSPSDDRIIRQTAAWAKKIVVGLGLCPFAGAALDTGRVRYRVNHSTLPLQVYEAFLEETRLFMTMSELELPTTLLVLPDAFEDFLEFQIFSDYLEDLIEQDDELGDLVLIASFHPKSTFAELDPCDPLHFEKRSPYPVINLLRAPVVDKYIDQGKTIGIAEANERRLKQEGFSSLKKAFDDLQSIR